MMAEDRVSIVLDVIAKTNVSTAKKEMDNLVNELIKSQTKARDKLIDWRKESMYSTKEEYENKFRKIGEEKREIFKANSEKLVQAEQVNKQMASFTASKQRKEMQAIFEVNDILARSGKKRVGFADVMFADMDEFKAYADVAGKTGPIAMLSTMYKQIRGMPEPKNLVTTFGKVGLAVRKGVHGMRGFRMELLSVMFLGMNLSQVFGQWANSMFDLLGITEYFNLQLQLMTLDVLEPNIDGIYQAIEGMEQWDQGTKDLIGSMSIMSSVFGPVLFVISSLVLGIGGLFQAFGPAAAGVSVVMLDMFKNMAGVIPGTALSNFITELEALTLIGGVAKVGYDVTMATTSGAAAGAAASAAATAAAAGGGAIAGNAWVAGFKKVIGALAGIELVITTLKVLFTGKATVEDVITALVAAGIFAASIAGLAGVAITFGVAGLVVFTTAWLYATLAGFEFLTTPEFDAAIEKDPARKKFIEDMTKIKLPENTKVAPKGVYVEKPWLSDVFAETGMVVDKNYSVILNRFYDVEGGYLDLNIAAINSANTIEKGSINSGESVSTMTEKQKKDLYDIQRAWTQSSINAVNAMTGTYSGAKSKTESAIKEGYKNPMESTVNATKIVVVDLSKSTSKEIADSVTAGKPYLETALQTSLVNPFIIAVDKILATMARIPTNMPSGGGSMPSAVATAGATYKAVSSTYGSASKAASDAANRLIQAITSNLSKFGEGGIVTRPTFAMVGEKGPEAIVPLNGRNGTGNVTYAPSISVDAKVSSDIDIRSLADRLNEYMASDYRRLTRSTYTSA
jgi:hypothetical protein